MSAMSASHLETKRLRLVPHAPKHMLALIQGPDSYERGFGWRPAAGLRDFIVSKDVSPDYLAQLDGSAVADPWTHGFGQPIQVALVSALDSQNNKLRGIIRVL